MKNIISKLEQEKKSNFSAFKIYLDLGFKYILYTKSFFKLKLKKQVLKQLIIVKSSYSYFNSYYKKFEYKKIDLNLLYKKKQLQLYFFNLIYIQKHRL